MEPEKAITRLFNFLEKKELKSVEKLLSEDFLLVGALPETINKESYLEFLQKLFFAFPDLKFNLQKATGIDADNATGVIQITGTHTGTLDLTMFTLGIVEPTNKKISLPAERVSISAEREKVTRMETETPVNGGLRGILEQIGSNVNVEKMYREVKQHYP